MNNYFRMIWKRRYYYLLGYLLALIIVIPNEYLNSNIKISDFIVMPIPLSFAFGFSIYFCFEETERVKKDWHSILYSEEGFIHLVLCIGLGIILSFIF